MAKMTLNIKGNPIVPCSGGVNTSGNLGIYELIFNVGSQVGYTGISYQAFGVPDRFQIYYKNTLVADSRFVGNSIQNPGNPRGGVSLGNYTLNNYTYNGSEFISTGTTTDITITDADFANNITQATKSKGLLLFNKIDTDSQLIRIVITGGPATTTTSWQITGVCPVKEEDLIDGEEKLIYCFFIESNKGGTLQSANFVLGNSPVKFYTDRLGSTDFGSYGHGTAQQYINDGVTWWRIDSTGNILDTGLI